jgi:hypothetical protein
LGALPPSPPWGASTEQPSVAISSQTVGTIRAEERFTSKNSRCQPH